VVGGLRLVGIDAIAAVGPDSWPAADSAEIDAAAVPMAESIQLNYD
jgi:hypothetical protein